MKMFSDSEIIEKMKLAVPSKLKLTTQHCPTPSLIAQKEVSI
jgi:hypothetical protein